jgi:hypothetical protein
MPADRRAHQYEHDALQFAIYRFRELTAARKIAEKSTKQHHYSRPHEWCSASFL